MIRHPPRSPLFPYTPLSRSDRLGHALRRQPHLQPLAVGDLAVLVLAAEMSHVRRHGAAVELHRRPIEPDVRDVVLSARSEEHTSELQSPCNLVCRLLLEKKK